MNTSINPWMTLELPPDRFEPLEVQLADQSVRRAIWTGTLWWTTEGEVMPQAWRPVHSAFESLQSA